MLDDDTSRVIENDNNDPFKMFFNTENSINSGKYLYKDNLLTSGRESESTLDAGAIKINSSDDFVIKPYFYLYQNRKHM